MDLVPQWDDLDVGAHVNLVLLPVMMDTPKGHFFRMVGTSNYVYLQGSISIRGTGTFIRLELLEHGIIPILGVKESTKQFAQGQTSYADVFRCLDLCSGAGFMSIGAKIAGYQDVGGIDQNPNFKPLYEQIHDGPFWHFDIGNPLTIEHCLDQGLLGATILSGINCQPYSRAGDRRGFADPRALSLPHSLRVAWFLQSPCVCLECTPAAAQDSQLQQMIRSYCQMAGFVPVQNILHLDRCWAARRDRWWCVLMPAILGSWTLPDLPIMSEYGSIKQVMPYLREWPSNDLDELNLTEYEHHKFLEFSGPLETLMIDPTKPMPTALHAWGNQLYPCGCGCRQAFSDQRLRSKGLHAMLIPTGEKFTHNGSDCSMCRHPHPNEVLLLSGMYPNLDFQGKMRLGLAAVGQLASPIQAAWVMGHARMHIESFMQLQHLTDPMKLLVSFQHSLLRARDLAWPMPQPLNPAALPDIAQPDDSSIEMIPITIEDTNASVVHQIRIVKGTSVEHILRAESELQQIPVQNLCIRDHHEQLPENHVLCSGDHVQLQRIDQMPPSPLVARQLFPPLDLLDGHSNDVVMSDSHNDSNVGGSLDLPLDLADPTPPRDVVPTVGTSVEAPPGDLLCRLPVNVLLQLVAPQVASQHTLDSLRSQQMVGNDRKHLLATHGDLWADDEIRFHFQNIVQQGPIEQGLQHWDPLAITSFWAFQHEHLIQQWGQSLPEFATVITAVWIKAHWVPIMWRKEAKQLYGYTFGNPDEHYPILQRFHAKVIGPLASGIVLATASQATPFLGKGHPISMGGLAIVVVGECDIMDVTLMMPTVVRFPAICIANNEPILVEGKVFQIGTNTVQRSQPKKGVEVVTIDTFVAKACVHRDLFQGDWENLITQPMKYIISQLPVLQVCTDQGCQGCGKWHATDSAKDPILAVWNRQWLSNAYTPVKPEAADMYVVTIRVPSSLEQSLLQVSGATAICMEPRELDGRSISKSYHVTWLPKMTFAQAMAVKQTTAGAIGLARLGNKWGIRCKIGDAARVYAAVKPDSSYLPSGEKQRYLMGPLPYGTLKQSVIELCQQMDWPCRPLQPAPAARSVEGIMWKIQATSPPPKHHIQLQSGDVVITRVDTPKEDVNYGPAAIASSTTLKLCSHIDSQGVDPLQVNDPWAKHGGPRILEVQAPGSSASMSTAAFEQQVVDNVLAKLPQNAMETDISERHHDRLTVLEAQVQQLTEQQTHIHAAVQDQGLAQQAQLTQLQHQFQAQHSQLELAVNEQHKQVQGLTSQFQQQLDKQKNQIDHMFNQQMLRMEDLLRAKKQRFE